MAIGLFDSGLGGLTVMRELIRTIPNANLIYIADTAGLPYGNKSPQVIAARATQCAQFLIEQGSTLLVIACFTASIHALQEIQKTVSIPVIGMIPHTIEALAPTYLPKRLALLGTTSTIQSNVLQTLLHTRQPSLQILPISCPLFVPFIEKGLETHPALQLVADSYLQSASHVDAAFLACTHYPIISPIIQKALGPHTMILDTAPSIAMQVKVRYDASSPFYTPTHHFYVTAAPQRFQALSSRFLGSTVEKVHYINLIQ